MITGVVLCGGKSTRMGTDKAFINYHGMPQYQYMANLLNGICSNLVISCNAQQKAQIPNSIVSLEDDLEYNNCGPLTGVLTAFKNYPKCALLVVACDYPLLEKSDLSDLVNNRSAQTDVVCFYNQKTGYIEPLLAIYEPICAQKLLTCFNSKQTSLAQFIKNTVYKTITCNNVNRITSFDTPETIQQYRI